MRFPSGNTGIRHSNIKYNFLLVGSRDKKNNNMWMKKKHKENKSSTVYCAAINALFVHKFPQLLKGGQGTLTLTHDWRDNFESKSLAPAVRLLAGLKFTGNKA